MSRAVCKSTVPAGYNVDDPVPVLNPWYAHDRVFARTIGEHGKIISKEDMLAPYNEKHMSNPNIRAINNCYQVINKDGAFKVVSNSLSQNFYN